jgi:hypothetical protein
VLEQLQIGAYQQQAVVDSAKVQQDEVAIGSTQSRIRADGLRVSGDRRRLQEEAVSSYINLNTGTDGAQLLFAGNETQELLRAQYEQVTSGDMNLTIDILRTDEKGLQAEEATLQNQEAQDQATADVLAAAMNAAQQTQVELQFKQSEVTGELAVAVAQQQAAQAAAAARAVRAAQAAATADPVSSPRPPSSGSGSGSKSSPTTTTQPAPTTSNTTPSGTASTTTPTPTPSLPPFLQCVLQAESSGNYQAVSPGSTYMGGFQFSQATWNEAAQLAGMPQLINVPPNQATPAQQDDLAIALYQADGQQPWNDSCRNS